MALRVRYHDPRYAKAVGCGDEMTNLDSIDGVHDSMFLFPESQKTPKSAPSSRARLTAMPAKAPAAMFCRREKLGGRDS